MIEDSAKITGQLGRAGLERIEDFVGGPLENFSEDLIFILDYIEMIEQKKCLTNGDGCGIMKFPSK